MRTQRVCAIARLCRGFRKDLFYLHRETRQPTDEVEPGARLSTESRERIKRLLEPRRP